MPNLKFKSQTRKRIFSFVSKMHNNSIIFFYRPVLFLPSREISVAVKFSPIKYELRPVARTDGVEEEEGKPWTKYQTLFALPYRLIYAVATKNKIVFYDTQQAEPFARVSNIHYVSLNDLAW